MTEQNLKKKNSSEQVFFLKRGYRIDDVTGYKEAEIINPDWDFNFEILVTCTGPDKRQDQDKDQTKTAWVRMFDKITGFTKPRNILNPHRVYVCWETLGIKESKIIQKRPHSPSFLKVNKQVRLEVRDHRKQLLSYS